MDRSSSRSSSLIVPRDPPIGIFVYFWSGNSALRQRFDRNRGERGEVTPSGGNGVFFLSECVDDGNRAEFGFAVICVVGVAYRNASAGLVRICARSDFPSRLQRCDWADVGRFLVSRADERNWKEDAWDVSVQHDEEARTDDACIGGGMWDVASDAAQKEVWRC